MEDILTLQKTWQNYSVLFVEDYEPLRVTLTEVFETYFHTTVTAVDGADGLQKYQEYMEKYKKPFDIVLTDIRMPNMNGIELTREIRRLSPAQAIIVLSAHKESDQLIEFINLGIDHYLCKPVNPEDIYHVFKSVTNKLSAKKKLPTPEESESITLAPDLQWNKKYKTLYQDGKELRLTHYELIVMETMITKLNQICTIDEFVNCFYAKNFDLDPANIRGHISKLRKKLPDLGITNLYGVGYKLENIEA